MKKLFLILCIVILAATPILFAACSRVSQTDMLSDPLIADNAEIYTYKIYHGTDVIGEMTLTFKKAKTQDVVLPDPTAANNQKVISAFSGTQLSMAYKMDGVYGNDEGYSEVLYGNDYSPVYSYKHTSVGGTVRDMCVVYETKYAYTHLYENGVETKSAEVKVKNTAHFDNEMLYAIVRASGISQSSYTMSFYSPNALTATRESITVSKVQEAKLKIPALLTANESEEEEQGLSCYEFRIAIANTYAKTYSMFIAKDPITATFTKDDVEYTVSNVKKAIVTIQEGEYSYILDRIEVI